MTVWLLIDAGALQLRLRSNQGLVRLREQHVHPGRRAWHERHLLQLLMPASCGGEQFAALTR